MRGGPEREHQMNFHSFLDLLILSTKINLLIFGVMALDFVFGAMDIRSYGKSPTAVSLDTVFTQKCQKKL